VCAQRFLVAAPVQEQFARKLAEAAAALVVGDGLEGPTDQGPLITAAAVAKVEAHVADALAKGAKVLTGGARVYPPGIPAPGGAFYAPTVLSGCGPHMLVFSEETFGPVAPIATFQTEAEAVALANSTRAGLASYVYTRDVGRLWRVAEALEFGIVGANTGLVSAAPAPFGGVKESGVGREGARQGLEEYLEVKYLCIGGLSA